MTCLKCKVGYSGQPKAKAVSYDSEKERRDHCTKLLEDALDQARYCADVAVFLYLARQFQRSAAAPRRNSVAEKLARNISDILFLSTCPTPARLSHQLVQGANFLGAEHGGRFDGQGPHRRPAQGKDQTGPQSPALTLLPTHAQE